MTRVVVVLMLVLSGSVALAQAPGETPALTPPPPAPHKEPGNAVSTIFDIVMAYRATNDWNREHALALTPTLMPATGGRAPGLALSLTF